MLSNPAFEYFASLYDPNYCTRLIKFCSGGRSPEAFASEINSTPEVFAYWARHHVEFECALHIAFWKSYAWWEKESMTNPDINGQIFNAVMKNRFKWKDGQEDLQKLVRNMNDKDLEELARRLLSEKTETVNIEREEETDEE